jgi:5-(carboxyamino)imidazole ribonucleotide mutase
MRTSIANPHTPANSAIIGFCKGFGKILREKTVAHASQQASQPGTHNTQSVPPLVGIILGSKSDLEVMQGAVEQLDEFGVPCELVIASAHRNPARVHAWAEDASARGIKVLIAAAGKAAHLAGVVAAYTPLPVIAVPMKTSDLGGLDSLLSMVQMPTGVPVATVAINGARNAAILATQILATGDDALRATIVAYKETLAE